MLKILAWFCHVLSINYLQTVS